MQDHRRGGRDCERPDPEVRKEVTNEEQDTAVESAVIGLILFRHPAQLTLAELIREVAEDPGEFRQADAIRRAVRDLEGVALLNRNGDFLVPSQAALRMWSLMDA